MKHWQLFSIVLLSFWLLATNVKAGGPTTAGANVHGTVRFEGKVPAAKPISMAADPVCAKQHPSPILAQEVMTDAKRTCRM